MRSVIERGLEKICLNCGTPLEGGTYVDFISEKEVCAACNTPIHL